MGLAIGLLLVLLPAGAYVSKLEAESSLRDFETQTKLLAQSLSQPFANLVISEDELQLELSVTQLAKHDNLYFVGIIDEHRNWIVHSSVDKQGTSAAELIELEGERLVLAKTGNHYDFKYPLLFAGKKLGTLVLGVPAGIVRKPIKRRSQAVMLLTGAATGASAFIVGLLLLILLRPIPAIQAFAKRISKGDFGATLATKRIDELGTLIQSLNEMSIDLDKSQTVKEQKQLLEAEMDIASEIQLALIPSQISTPDFIDLAAHFAPAKDVGGDFYHCVEGQKNDYYVVVADVSGKGIGSALLGSQIQGMFATLLRLSPSPADALCQINTALYQHSRLNLYCTAAVARICDDGSVEIVNAGHCASRILGSSGLQLTKEGDSIALGITTTDQFKKALITESFVLDSTQTLVMFSDGVTEALNSDGEQYGDARFDESLSTLSGSENNHVVGEILGQLAAFVLEKEQSDDITVVAASIAG